MEPTRPILRMLSQEMVEKIVSESHRVLEEVGVVVENDDALALLHGAGMRVDGSERRVWITADLIQRALDSAPHSISVYNRHGELAMNLGGDRVHFNPGSAALTILDSKIGAARPPNTSDYIKFTRLTEALEHLAAQSTALIPDDVPKGLADRYRLFLSLQHAAKPVVTGTFACASFQIMRDMLVVVRGGDEELRRKPLAIFDCCPSPPLQWSSLSSHDLMACARAGIPAELVSMPLSGATAPATLAGALVQHTAENLCGVVIHQLAHSGAPIIYGGSPALFDMRSGTTPMGAIETMMIESAYAQIGNHLGLPTHAYMGLSDAKLVDAQAGFESGMGAVIAALSGVNLVSGPGMLDFESCQSPEKLVIDNEICGSALRLVEGIAQRTDPMGLDLWGDLSAGDHFLTSPTTLQWFRREAHFPSMVVDRMQRNTWRDAGGTTVLQRAQSQIAKLLGDSQVHPLGVDETRELERMMLAEARRAGMNTLP